MAGNHTDVAIIAAEKAGGVGAVLAEKASSRSVTNTMRQFLDDTERKAVTKYTGIFGTTESVIEKAQSEGLTLQQYVNENPDKAIMEAEAAYNEWLKVQASAAIEGCIRVGDTSYEVTRNTSRLIESRVQLALKQLEQVQMYAVTAYNDGERRRDHLIRTLYNKAVQTQSVSAIKYLIDRIDGRPDQARQVDLDYDNAYNVYQILHVLFDKQLEVLNSGNGTRLICCSRRSGKTLMLVAACLIECLRTPNVTCIYIGKTMAQTELLVNTAANELVDACQLRDKQGKRLNWKHLDNGSKLLIRGLSNTQDPDTIRGHKAKMIVIDEFFHMNDKLVDYLVKEVLQPMQMDYSNEYKFLCAGTPPAIKGTYGEYAWKHWEVPHFYWTYKDNPYPTSIEARDAYVENILKEKGLDWTSVYARREYLGEWIYDDDLLLYPEYHVYDEREGLPQFNIDTVLFGIDYGVSDNDCLIGIAWDSQGHRGYVFHEDKFNRLDIKDRTISQLQYLHGQVKIAWEKAFDFFPGLTPKEANKYILWDADDNNQHLTDDLCVNVRCSQDPSLRLAIQNAHKTDKVMMFDKIKDLLRTSALLLPIDGKTVEECVKTVLERGPQGQIYPEVDHKVYHPDLLPAMRYALWNVLK